MAELDDEDGKLWNPADHFPLRYQCCICDSPFAEGDELVGREIPLPPPVPAIPFGVPADRNRSGRGKGEHSSWLHDQLVQMEATRPIHSQRPGPVPPRGVPDLMEVPSDGLRPYRLSARIQRRLPIRRQAAPSMEVCRARQPHPTMPSVVLPPPGAYIALKLPEGCRSDDVFARLPWLSVEVVGEIRKLSSSLRQWHILAGLALSERLSGPRPQVKLEGLPLLLNDIASWERGQGIDSVVRRNVGAQGSGHVRLVMDIHGIQKVESVPYEQGCNTDERPDDRVFITVPGNDFG